MAIASVSVSLLCAVLQLAPSTIPHKAGFMQGQLLHLLQLAIQLLLLLAMASNTPWVLKAPREPARRQGAKIRLFCLPQAGSGAWMYHEWQAGLPNDVEVMPVELPGHNSRGKEPPITSMKALVEAMATALAPLMSEMPFALFGHSMGAWVVYALAQELQSRGGPQPVKVYVSGNRSPLLAGVDNDVDPVTMHQLPSADFWGRFEGRYGKMPGLEDPKIRAFVEPTLRADFQVLETYRPAAAGQPPRLPCPLTALCGTEDRRVVVKQLGLWAEVGPEGQFDQHLFWGGHDYVFTLRSELLGVLTADLQQFTAVKVKRPQDSSDDEEGPAAALPVSTKSSCQLPANGAAAAAAEGDGSEPAVIPVVGEDSQRGPGSSGTHAAPAVESMGRDAAAGGGVNGAAAGGAGAGDGPKQQHAGSWCSCLW